MKESKRFKAASAKVDAKKFYSIDEAVELVKAGATAKFTEAVDIAVRLGVDPKKADQAIRGTVALPHGIGKEVRVLVIAKPPKDEEARQAGELGLIKGDDFDKWVKPEEIASLAAYLCTPEAGSINGNAIRIFGGV